MGQRSRPAVLLTGAESYDRGPPAGGQDLLGPVGCQPTASSPGSTCLERFGHVIMNGVATAAQGKDVAEI
jgi:hypothetical protein